MKKGKAKTVVHMIPLDFTDAELNMLVDQLLVDMGPKRKRQKKTR